MPAAPGGAGAREDELADELRVPEGQRLGDHAAQGEREDVDRVEAQGLDEGDGVLGHRLDRVRDGAGGCADAAVVEGDHVVLGGDGIDDGWVPVVQGAGEVDEEDHGNPRLRAELAVGESHSAGGDGAGRCVLV